MTASVLRNLFLISLSSFDFQSFLWCIIYKICFHPYKQNGLLIRVTSSTAESDASAKVPLECVLSDVEQAAVSLYRSLWGKSWSELSEVLPGLSHWFEVWLNETWSSYWKCWSIRVTEEQWAGQGLGFCCVKTISEDRSINHLHINWHLPLIHAQTSNCEQSKVRGPHTEPCGMPQFEFRA